MPQCESQLNFFSKNNQSFTCLNKKMWNLLFIIKNKEDLIAIQINNANANEAFI